MYKSILKTRRPAKLLLTTSLLALASFSNAQATCSPSPTTGADAITCTASFTTIDTGEGNDTLNINAGTIAGSQYGLINTQTIAGTHVVNVDGSSSLDVGDKAIISFSGTVPAVGIDLTVNNQGSITSSGTITSTGAVVSAPRAIEHYYGDFDLINSGLIDVKDGSIANAGIAVVAGQGIASGSTDQADIINSGTISGDAVAIKSRLDTTISNSGLIDARSDNVAIEISNGTNGETHEDSILNSGVIDGRIFTGDGSDTINNFGSIAGGSIAGTGGTTVSRSIFMQEGDDYLVNRSTGTINGGFVSTGTGDDTVENAGTIAGDGTLAVNTGLGNDSFINRVGGVIDLGHVFTDAGDDTIDNAGFIAGDGTYSASLHTGDDVIINRATGTLSGGRISVNDGDDTIINDGLVTGNGTDVIDTGNGNDVITNGGTMENGFVQLGSGNDLITNSGSISGNGIQALGAGDGNDTVVITSTGVVNNGSFTTGLGTDTVQNDGTIFTTLDTGDDSDTITNNGEISSAGSIGIQAGGANDTVTNAGIINSGSIGVDLGDNTSATDSNLLTNFGIITGTQSAVNGAGGNDIVINNNLINGSISLLNGSDTVDNSGTITGDGVNAIALGNDNDLVLNRAGGVINNNILTQDGLDSINNFGTITGNIDLGNGVDNFTQTSGAVNGNISFGANADNSNETFNVSGGTIDGLLTMGGGDDVAVIDTDNVNYDLSHVFDGDAGTESGSDTITFISTPGLTYGLSKAQNWQEINFTGNGNNVVTQGQSGNNSATINFGAGDDIFATGGTITGTVNLGDGNDTVAINTDVADVSNAFFDGGAGIDQLGMQSSIGSTFVPTNINFESIVFGGGGTFSGSGTTTGGITKYVLNGEGTSLRVNSGASYDADVCGDSLGNGVIIEGTINGDSNQADGVAQLFGGHDSVIVRGEFNGSIDLGSGANIVDVDGGTLNGDVVAGLGNDTVLVTGVANGTIDLSGGANTLNVTGGTLNGAYVVNNGDDRVIANNGLINLDLDLKNGDNFVNAQTGSTIAGNVTAGTGNDTVIVDGTITGNVNLNEGNNYIELTDGIISGDITAAGGDDTILVNNDTITGLLELSGGDNQINGGTVTNSGTFETPLTVNANYVQDSTGVLNVIIDSDDVNSTGTAGVVEGLVVNGDSSLAGVINVTNNGDISNFTLGEEYDIISSTGSITNNGVSINTSSFTVPSAYLLFSKVGPNNVTLQILANQLNCNGGVTLTTNAQALCDAINDTITNITDPEAIALFASMNADEGVLEQLHAGGYAASMNAISRANSGFVGTLTNRLGELRSMRPFNKRDQDVSLWVRGVGDIYSVDDVSEATNVGIQLGADYRLERTTQIGLTLGYGTSSVELDQQNFDNSINLMQAAAYYSHATDEYHIDAIVSYGMADSEVERKIKFGSVNSKAKADFDSSIFSAQLEGGYVWKHENWQVGPWAGLRYEKVNSDAVKESGAGQLNLNIDEYSEDRLNGFIGVRSTYEGNSRDGSQTFVPEFSLRLERDLIDPENVSASIMNGAVEFESEQSPAENNIVFDIGGTLMLNDADGPLSQSLYANYELELGFDEDFEKTATGHRVSVGYKYKF